MDIENERQTWGRLLSCKRLEELISSQTELHCRNESRNPFERDCDRITYSYPFRRLQDKTQVIPLPVTDFVHTRLTHTLEVTTVGRSLGRLLETWLFNRKIIETINIGDIPAILNASCLAHDIGNPPFGHSGEASISEYFKFGNGKDYLIEEYGGEVVEIGENEKGQPILDYKYKDDLSRIKCTDLRYFEGNANGLRILTKHNDQGLNLTAATLGTFSKYPRTSFIPGETAYERWDKSRASQKKYGVFYSERDQFELIAKELGLIELFNDGQALAYARHPLAFLLEAADDICYRIIDLEDGIRIGRIPFKEAELIMLQITIMDDRYSKKQYENLKDDKIKIAYLRSKSINYLVFQCFEVFIKNYTAIIEGKFDMDLLSQIKDANAYKATKEIRELVKKYIYKWDEVLALEATGFEVLSGLIGEYIEASNLCISCPELVMSYRAKKIYDLLPDQYCHLDDDEERYSRYLKVADYTSGMSDSFALNIFRKIKGIQIK